MKAFEGPWQATQQGQKWKRWKGIQLRLWGVLSSKAAPADTNFRVSLAQQSLD